MCLSTKQDKEYLHVFSKFKSVTILKSCMGRSLKALLGIAFGNCHVMEYLIQTKGSFSIELGHNSILSLITFSGIVDINRKKYQASVC